MPSLLDQARLVPTRVLAPAHERYSRDTLDLLLAWLHGELTSPQVAAVLHISPVGVSHRCGAILKHAISHGDLTITLTSPIQSTGDHVI